MKKLVLLSVVAVAMLMAGSEVDKTEIINKTKLKGAAVNLGNAGVQIKDSTVKDSKIKNKTTISGSVNYGNAGVKIKDSEVKGTEIKNKSTLKGYYVTNVGNAGVEVEDSKVKDSKIKNTTTMKDYSYNEGNAGVEIK